MDTHTQTYTRTLNTYIHKTYIENHIQALIHTHTYIGTHTYEKHTEIHTNTHIKLPTHWWLGWCNGSQAILPNLHEWVRVSLGTPFIRPCVTSKQNASWITTTKPSRISSSSHWVPNSNSLVPRQSKKLSKLIKPHTRGHKHKKKKHKHTQNILTYIHTYTYYFTALDLSVLHTPFKIYFRVS